MVLEKTTESPLDCKKIQIVHPKENQSWIFTGRTDAEAETPILRPPDGKNWLTGKDRDVGKDWRQEEKGTTKDEMVGWHHRLDGHELEHVLGVDDEQGSLVFCRPWGHKELDLTEWLNWTELYFILKRITVSDMKWTKLQTKCRNTQKLYKYFSSVQLPSCVWLFATPWSAARQASLSITKFWSLPKLMSIKSVVPSNHLIFCHPLLLLPSIFPSIRVFSNESAPRIRWPKNSYIT